jgi:hypothetical protein
MLGHLRRHAIGYLALFCFALGGTAIALPGKNKVDSGDIKNGQVKRKDLAANAVNSSKVADESLKGSDIDESSLDLPTHERRLLLMPGDLQAGAGAPTFSAHGGLPSVAFADAAGNERVEASAELPDRVAGTPVTARLVWSTNSVGSVVWALGYRGLNAGDTTNQLFTSLPTQTSTTADSMKLVELSFTLPSSAADGHELLNLDLGRNGPDAADTLGSAAFLHFVELRYTTAD